MNNGIMGLIGTTAGVVSIVNPAEVLALVATCICAAEVVLVWLIKIFRALRRLKKGDITEDEAIDAIHQASDEARRDHK